MRRLRRTRMAASGLLLAAAPVAAMQQPAAASETFKEGTASVTFVKIGGGAATCTVIDDALHNNDDPNQPYVGVSSGLQGADSACFDTVLITVVVSYKDQNGVRRTTTNGGLGTGTLQVGGAYSGVQTTVRADFFGCDSSASATCSAIATANPK